ncbi:hypothetical protein DMENIID0001_170040 [Sergentomyia squamirostris]
MSYEDEDLESLRLAALQTLNPRPKVTANPIQVVDSVKPRYQEEVYPEVVPKRGAFIETRIDVLTSGVTSGAWVPPQVQIPLSEVQYVPPYVAPELKTDVQLSPRSAAFVLQNNSILRRRKGDKSPSISPPPYKSSLAVPWDPPSPEYAYRRVSRSRSKSPKVGKSPIYRHRSPASPKRFYSRSPVRRERSLTRSPPPVPENYRNRRRTRTRSPPPVRRPSPRVANRSRNTSPRPVRSRRQSPVNFREERGLREGTHRPPRKVSRSPPRPPRNRSHSPPPPLVKRAKTPPPRKPRRLRDTVVRRRSVERHPVSRGKNDRRPRREEKKPTPPRPRRRSRSRSIEKMDSKSSKVDESKRESTIEVKTREKTPDIVAEENQASSEEHLEEDPTSDVENAADEIDLFASEESESENEGRFKSSSSKNERSAPTTVSFSKLVSEPLSSITELKELPTLANVSRASSRERRSDRSSREYGRGRRKRERDRRAVRGQRDVKSSSAKVLDKDSRQKNTKNQGESNMKMFKSTFQAVVVNETKKQVSDCATVSDKGVKDADKRKIIQIKKPISFKESKDKSEVDPPSSVNGQQPPGQSLGLSTDGKMKKSIHLRLGGYAPANGESTSSTSSSSLASVFASTSSKALKSGNLANLKKSWKTSEKVSMKYCLMILSSCIF